MSGLKRMGTTDRFFMHWPEYMMEMVLLGMFMISACASTAILEYPA